MTGNSWPGAIPAESTLDLWPESIPGEIVAIEGTDPIACRLLEMGILEGEPVKVLGYAPLGDPMEIRLRDYQISLRLSEAKRVRVRPASNPGE